MLHRYGTCVLKDFVMLHMSGADVFASLFEDLDLVASDLAAALVLLRLKRKYEEQREESFRKIDRQLPISRSSTASVGKPQCIASCTEKQDVKVNVVLCRVNHTFKKYCNGCNTIFFLSTYITDCLVLTKIGEL